VETVLHDLKEHSEIKGVVSSPLNASDAQTDCLCAEQTLRHIDTSIGADETTSFALAARPLTQLVGGPLPIQTTDDDPRTPACVLVEGERPDPPKRADTPCCLPSNDVVASSLPLHLGGDNPNSVHHVPTPGNSRTSDAPPPVVITAPYETPSPSHLSAVINSSKIAEADETPTSADGSQSLLLACLPTGTPSSFVTSSTEQLSPTSSSKHLPELPPPSPLPRSPSLEPLLRNQDAQASVNRKRKRQDKNAIFKECQQDKLSTNIATRISSAILSGGRKYESSTFETWKRDLWLLNPDRAKLTLDGLLTQQRTYTEALLCQGIVARIIHSWCLIAYEYQLAVSGRGRSTRRNQKEIRLSLRCRKLGVLFLEIINQLFSQRDIGIDAYKVCPAIAGKCSSQCLPAIN
jgi:hypothetical protein